LVDLLNVQLKGSANIKWWYRVLKSASEVSSGGGLQLLPGSSAPGAAAGMAALPQMDSSMLAPASGGLPKQLTHVGPKPPAREPSSAEAEIAAAYHPGDMPVAALHFDVAGGTVEDAPRMMSEVHRMLVDELGPAKAAALVAKLQNAKYA
jgi:hypothetical protein